MDKGVGSVRSITVLIVDSTGRKTVHMIEGDTLELSLSDKRVGGVVLEVDGILVEKFGGEVVDINSLLAFEYMRKKMAFNMTVPFLRYQNDYLKAVVAKWQKVGKRIDKMLRRHVLNVQPGSYIDPVDFQDAALEISYRVEKLSIYKPNIGIPKKR